MHESTSKNDSLEIEDRRMSAQHRHETVAAPPRLGGKEGRDDCLDSEPCQIDRFSSDSRRVAAKCAKPGESSALVRLPSNFERSCSKYQTVANRRLRSLTQGDSSFPAAIKRLVAQVRVRSVDANLGSTSRQTAPGSAVAVRVLFCLSTALLDHPSRVDSSDSVGHRLR